MSCCYPQTADQQFCEKAARQDLARYRKKGPDPTTGQLLEAIRETALDRPSVLDVGAGIGVIQLELLPEEAVGVVHVEAARGYHEAAREEAERQGKSQPVRFVRGDFVELETELPESDVVTLDRVVCCYPDLEPLVLGSARKATHLWAASYPRDYWLPRFGVVLENLFRKITGSDFRTFVHPTEVIERLLEAQGFALSYKHTGFLWEATAWRR
ncbi:MAG: class I SAM-dependent methyltransferase [Thermoanaerobaculia bacterium]